MAKIFLVELLAKFTGDVTDLDRSMTKAEGLMAKFTTAAKYGAVAVGGLTTAFAALVIHQMHVGDELGKMADRAGDTTEHLIALGHATQLAGLDTAQLGNVLKFMQKNVVEAAAGNKDLEKSLSRIGTSSKELLNMTTSDAFRKILSGLGNLGSAAERTNIAMQLLGRSGQDVLSVARKGGEYFQKMAEEADRFGLTISRIDSESLNDANDSVDRLGDAASGAARQFAVGIAPAISTVNERLLAAIDVADLFKTAGDMVGDAWVAAIQRISTALSQWEQLSIKVAATAKNILFKGTAEEGDAIQKMADARIQAIQNRLDLAAAGKAGSFKNDYDAEKERLRKENQKLKSSKGTTMGGGVDIPLSEAALKEAQRAAKEYQRHLEEAYKKTIDYNNATADSFIQVKDAFLAGGKAADVMKKMALNALNEIGNNIIKMSFGGTSGGGIFGSIASSIMGAMGGKFGGGTSFFKSTGNIDWLPAGQSFAVGTPYVPHDMVAQLHEGEAVIPKAQNKMASGLTVVQNISIGAGVQGTVRAELAKALPEIKRAAIAGVEDSRQRGQIS